MDTALFSLPIQYRMPNVLPPFHSVKTNTPVLYTLSVERLINVDTALFHLPCSIWAAYVLPPFHSVKPKTPSFVPMGESFQDFEDDFPQKVILKMLSELRRLNKVL